MFFDDLKDIPSIASRVGTAVFVIPKDAPLHIKTPILLRPEGKTTITIDQVRDVLSRISIRQTSDIFIVIRPADAMGTSATNALLKTLEEPHDKVHFVLVTDSPSQILPTILSRAAIYIMRDTSPIDGDISASDKDKALAKRLLVAKGSDLVDIAEEISRRKDGVRAYAITILGISIEMLYKSYFLTGKEVFIAKLPNFLRAYEDIMKNGHVKLQIVSNLC